MFHSIASGTASDHILIGCVAREGEILNSLRRNLPNVIAVHVPTITCGAFMSRHSDEKDRRGPQSQQAIMATFGTETYSSAGLAIAASRRPDWVGWVAVCVAARHGAPRPLGARFHRRPSSALGN